MLHNIKFQVLAIAAILCAAYSAWLAPAKAVHLANLKLEDSYFEISSKLNPASSSCNSVVVVAVDDESLRRMNVKWPWPRSVVAELINKTSSQSPRLIIADLVFAGKSPDPNDDAQLVTALKNAKNVFGAAYFGADGRYMMPSEEIALSMSSFGFVNKPKDEDDFVRRMRPYFLSTSGEMIDQSLSLKAAASVLNEPSGNIIASLPLSKDGTAVMDFFGKPDKFNTIPAWKVAEGTISPNLLKNKIVLLGVTSESFHDVYATPLGMMPGVYIDLNEMLTYINKSFFRYGTSNMNLIIVFLFLLIAVTGALRLPLIPGVIFSVTLIGTAFLAGLLFFSQRILIDAFGPILLIAIATILIHGTRFFRLALDNMILKKEAITDGLTGLHVYRYFELQLKRQLNEAARSHKNLALVIYDIDHFKKINDTYGHEFGNTVLKGIAKSLKDRSRKNNTIARYGGEEFCIIISGMDQAQVMKYCERLRNLVGSLEFKNDKGETVKVTMSGGIVFIKDIPYSGPADFVKAADCALYRSKKDGRDRISVFDKASDNIETCK